jgi:arylsulfatase A-like enzyme
MAKSDKPNILIIWGDDIGYWNVSRYSNGQMGYRTKNIDRIGEEGITFTDFYGQQSCTAGRACFITGQNPIRTGLTKVGMPGATVGLHKEDPTIAEMLKPLGYATGQFGKNHLGDRNEFLPTVHGFEEFYGNLYHLNAEEEPELPSYPKDPAFKKMFGRAVSCTASRAMLTIRQKTLALAALASRPSPIPVRLPRSAWRQSTRRSPIAPWRGWRPRPKLKSRSFCGTIRRPCTSVPT